MARLFLMNDQGMALFSHVGDQVNSKRKVRIIEYGFHIRPWIFFKHVLYAG